MNLFLLLSCNTPEKCTLQINSGTYDANISWSDTTVDQIVLSLTNEERQIPVDSSDIWVSALPALESVTVQAFTGNQLRCEQTFQTQNAAPNLPQIINDEINGPVSWHGLLGTTMGETSSIWLLDPNGRFRWAMAVDDERIVSDAHIQDNILWHNSASTNAEAADSRLIQRGWDTTESERIETPYGHHVFHLHDDGRIAQLEVDIRSWFNPQTQNDEQVAGDRIVIIHPDGSTEILFSLWDELVPSLNPHWNSGFYGPIKDWSHANSLSFSASRNSYLVAFANLDQIFEIDASTGDVLLVIDSHQWFFTYDSPVFHYPHNPRWLSDDELMLFSHSDGQGTAVVYKIDTEALTLDAQWQYSSPISAGFLGQSIPLESGNILINYGGSGMLQEVTSNGLLVWQAETALGSWFGNIEVLEHWPQWETP